LITLITIPYAKDNFSDVIEAMESSTEKVKIIEGSYENIKVTTPIDITTAEEILKSRRV
jgi:2-C-methyl-D-erythritol 4-phosphate cytidylyltransferase